MSNQTDKQGVNVYELGGNVNCPKCTGYLYKKQICKCIVCHSNIRGSLVIKRTCIKCGWNNKLKDEQLFRIMCNTCKIIKEKEICGHSTPFKSDNRKAQFNRKCNTCDDEIGESIYICTECGTNNISSKMYQPCSSPPRNINRSSDITWPNSTSISSTTGI